MRGGRAPHAEEAAACLPCLIPLRTSATHTISFSLLTWGSRPGWNIRVLYPGRGSIVCASYLCLWVP